MTEVCIQGQKALTSWRRQQGVCAAPVAVVAGPQGADGSGLLSFTMSTAKRGSLHPDKSDAQDLSLPLENREPTKPRVTSRAKVVWQESLPSSLCGLPEPSAVRCGPSHTLPPRAAVCDVLQHQTWSLEPHVALF